MIITEFHRQRFTPTYLYIKQHTITGKLYFGKTTKKNVEKYTGSGIHWGRHINLHDKDKVATLWYCLFTDIDNLVETALKMSEIMNITESDDWLNFKPESGLDGGSFKGFNGFAGKKQTEKQRTIVTELGKTRPATDNMRANMARVGKLPRTQAQSDASKIKAKRMGDANKGKKASDETRNAMSLARTDKGHGIIYTIQTPSGIVTTDCLKKWCTENNITYSSLRNTITNKVPHKKTGFMILSSAKE